MPKSKLLNIFLIYFVSIFVFAAIYHGIWFSNTSSFVISQEYNLTTIPPTFMTNDLPETFDDYKIKSVQEVNTELAEIYKKYVIIKKRSGIVNDSISIFKQNIERLGNKLTASRNDNLIREITTLTAAIGTTKAHLQHQLDSLEKKAIASKFDTYGVKRANFRVKIALQNIEEARIKERIYNQAFDAHFDKGLYKQSKELMAANDLIQIESYRLEEQIRNFKNEISDLTLKYDANRKRLIDYWDFLYFSMGAATSSNFGDILPNTKSIRLLVVVQIIIGLIFLGVLVNEAMDKISK